MNALVTSPSSLCEAIPQPIQKLSTEILWRKGCGERQIPLSWERAVTHKRAPTPHF